MTKKHMHVKVEDTLLNNFDTVCRQHGLDRSEVVRNLMFEFVKNNKEVVKMQVLINGLYQNITGAAAKIVRAQPGYSAGGQYALSKTKQGGIRLYKDVSGKWMDASLADITDDNVTALLE